mmetsp:Transcript_96285/g.310890  ORF Transcript_96285/g.310890 Transcript_96285/m.310890 type:complete len:249 (+) Transcript_96285:97-843(+)
MLCRLFALASALSCSRSSTVLPAANCDVIGADPLDGDCLSPDLGLIQVALIQESTRVRAMRPLGGAAEAKASANMTSGISRAAAAPAAPALPLAPVAPAPAAPATAAELAAPSTPMAPAAHAASAPATPALAIPAAQAAPALPASATAAAAPVAPAAHLKAEAAGAQARGRQGAREDARPRATGPELLQSAALTAAASQREDASAKVTMQPLTAINAAVGFVVLGMIVAGGGFFCLRATQNRQEERRS